MRAQAVNQPLESALDELAEKLGIDPVDLRRINDTANDPIDGKPYSSRSLMNAMIRPPKPSAFSAQGPIAGPPLVLG